MDILEIPKSIYHATFSAHLPNIQRRGLIPGGDGFRCWDRCTPGVYFHSDADVAVSYAESTDNQEIPEEWFDNIIVLEIDSSQLNIELFELDPEIAPPDNVDSFIYHGIVPSKTIKNIL